jgi:hypothetical protein
LLWGYVITVRTINAGGSSFDTANVIGATNHAVYEHSTAWFEGGDVFVSTGSVLYYILTGRLGMTLLLSGPWMIVRIVRGWGRINLIGHVMALLAVYHSRTRASSGSKPLQRALLMAVVLIVVLVLFPMLGITRTIQRDTGLGVLDVFAMAMKRMSFTDLVSGYVSTQSFLAGFESSFYHLVVDKRSELGIEYFYFYFIAPIPRALWHGKGIVFEWPYRLLGIDWDPIVTAIGMAPGAIGMAFQQWGWLGIPFEFFVTGWVMRWAEEKSRQRPEAAHVQLAYVGLYSIVPQLGRDSLFYMIATRWLYVFGIPVFILWRIYLAEIRGQQARSELASMHAGKSGRQLIAKY